MCISTFTWTSMCVFAYLRTDVYNEMCMGVGMCMVCFYVLILHMYVNIHVFMSQGTSTEFDQNSCVICRKGFEVQVQRSTVTRGLPNLIEYCRLRRNWALHSYLIQQNSSSPPGIVYVHPMPKIIC